MPRKKVLFFSHAVTMAHFTRPLKWIECLVPDKYEVFLASDKSFENFVDLKAVKFISISCLDSKLFLENVENCKTIYDAKTFSEHVAEDIRVMEQVQPDLVIGDYRLSLSVSCRLKKIKYINITNAYWSPNAVMKFPLPEAPLVRLVGEKIANFFRPMFINTAIKVNLMLLAFTMRSNLKKVHLSFFDYRRLLVDGDLTVYCDIEKMVPLKKQTKSERYVGPIVWSMPVALPKWWKNLNQSKSRIFVSLGSSGNSSQLPMIVSILAKLNCEVIVAVGYKKIDLPQYENVFVTDFLPIEDACKNTALVICNGGSPMTHSALKYGVPTIGIISNNDQLLNMSHIEKLGAGIMLRSWNLNAEKLLQSVNVILSNSEFKTIANELSLDFTEKSVHGLLNSIIEESIDY